MTKTRTFKKDNTNTETVWYHRDAEWLNGVTTDDINTEIGIKKIFVFMPTQKQANVGIVAKVGIQIMTFIEGQYIFTKASIRETQTGNLFFAPEGSSKYTNKDGEEVWDDAYSLPIAYKAQVLRHVESLFEE